MKDQELMSVISMAVLKVFIRNLRDHTESNEVRNIRVSAQSLGIVAVHKGDLILQCGLTLI